jgi:hypothetical protein
MTKSYDRRKILGGLGASIIPGAGVATAAVQTKYRIWDPKQELSDSGWGKIEIAGTITGAIVGVVGTAALIALGKKPGSNSIKPLELAGAMAAIPATIGGGIAGNAAGKKLDTKFGTRAVDSSAVSKHGLPPEFTNVITALIEKIESATHTSINSKGLSPDELLLVQLVASQRRTVLVEHTTYEGGKQSSAVGDVVTVTDGKLTGTLAAFVVKSGTRGTFDVTTTDISHGVMKIPGFADVAKALQLSTYGKTHGKMVAPMARS